MIPMMAGEDDFLGTYNTSVVFKYMSKHITICNVFCEIYIINV